MSAIQDLVRIRYLKILITSLLLFSLVACDIQPVNKVGYGKKLDEAVYENCFYEEFEEYRAATNYQLSVEVEKEKGKITYYELTIDGTNSIETYDVFTPRSYKQSKQFMMKIIEECSVRSK